MDEQYLLNMVRNAQEKRLSGLFCSSCQIEFSCQESHKLHYKTDLHQYNLKRKMLNLNPVAKEIFEEQVRKYKEQKKKQSQFQQSQENYCRVCNKSFKSRETFHQHSKSKKHLKNLKKPKKIQKQEEIKIEETTLYKIENCLFCNFQSENFEENLNHMKKHHSFFICEEANCTDKSKVIMKLAKIIFQDRECIYCCYDKLKNFSHFQDVQKHMIDTGHCFMNQDNLEEFIEFYSFTGENQEIVEKYFQKDKEGNPIIDEEELVRFKIREDDEWESIDEESFENITESQSAQVDQNILDQYDLRDYVRVNSKITHTGELRLPNNKLLGHRQYEYLYKQYHRENSKKQALKFLESRGKLKQIEQMNDKQIVKFYNKEVRLERKIQQQDHLKNLVKNDKALKSKFALQKKAQLNKLMRHNKVLTTHYKDSSLIFG